MKPYWPLKTAQFRFEEIVEAALRRGRQMITRNGQEVVAVIAAKEYRQLKQPAGSLLECLSVPAQYAVELDITRSNN